MPDEGVGQARETTSPFYITASAISSQSRPRVLKRGGIFAVLDGYGNSQAFGPGAEGLFFEDTRYLSQVILTVDGLPPVLLSSVVSEDNTALTADFTNPELKSPDDRMLKDSLHLLSTTALTEDGLEVRVHIRNFGRYPADFVLRLDFDADFADIFEVRGAVRPKRGTMLADDRSGGELTISYLGLDMRERRTRFSFEPKPTVLQSRSAEWRVAVEPHAERTVRMRVACERQAHAGALAAPLPDLAKIVRRIDEVASVETSNLRFNDWLVRSRADIDMLVTDTPQGPYAYAGIPWFSTAFGRDGIITALLCLWLDPALAAGTLRFLAANQATELDPKADAEPGKILHETRQGEMALLGEVPFGRYYGSIDSTPLFIVLAAAYYQRTGDLALIGDIWPNIEAALAWMKEYGDPDGDGFLEYDRKSANGLINQGWKDSSDSIFHADGRLAEAPIALAEVQAYAYAAYCGATLLARRLGKAHAATEFEVRANTLYERFDEAFWLEDIGTYAIALDGDKKPCRVRSSNAGQVLFGGLARPERARRVAESLTAPESFSGWGIRTIAEGEARYNPVSYHNGSIWPHDNALIALGFGRYSLKEPLMRVMGGLFDATHFLDLHRQPELFCGFVRRRNVGPTGYPVACIPQAWSSASVFAMLGAALGVSFDAAAGRVNFYQPALPAWLDECHVRNLRVGNGSLDLLFRRMQDDVAVHVLRRKGSVEVAVTI
jgi:glycogen debranching enzyme